MDRSAPAIEARALAKRYGSNEALSGLSLQIPAGEVIGLLGHNGAGKTTFIKLVLGLILPSSGTLTVLGALPHASPPAWRGRIGYLPESVTFYDNLTGAESIGYFETLKRAPRGDGIRLLRQVGLEAAADKPVKAYSKGMRQRLGLAQALLGSPDLLLLDEPTTGLDPDAIHQFYEVITRLRAAGKTIVISSHLLAELEPHIDRAIILGKGRLLREGTVAELRTGAGLPITFAVRISGDRAGFLRAPWLVGLEIQPVQDDGCFEIRSPAERKMDLMRHLATAAGVEDIDIRQATLASLYYRTTSPQPEVGREAP